MAGAAWIAAFLSVFIVAAWMANAIDTITRSPLVLAPCESVAGIVKHIVPQSADTFALQRYAIFGPVPVLQDRGYADGGWTELLADAIAGRFRVDPCLFNGEQEAIGRRGVNLAAAHVVVCAVLAWQIRRRVQGRGKGDETWHSTIRFAALLASATIPILVAAIAVARPMSWMWFNIPRLTGFGAWVVQKPSFHSAPATAAILYAVGLICASRAIARRRVRAGSNSDTLHARCWKCGYHAGKLEHCPECGQREPARDPRFFLTCFGARLARARLGWLLPCVWALAFALALTLPVWMAAILIYQYRLL